MAPSRGGLAFMRAGLPLVMLTVGGYLAVAHVLSGKFELRDAKERYVELKPATAKTGSSLEAELERTQRQLDIENFENKPVPKL